MEPLDNDFGEAGQGMVGVLDAFRASRHRVEEFIERQNDIAHLHDLAASYRRRLAARAFEQANEDLPVEPDR